MHHQLPQTTLHGHSRRESLFLCCFKGDDNITQQIRGNFGKRPLSHGKRDNIGRPLPLKIRLVQNSDLWIIKKKDGKFAIRTAQGA